MRINKISHITKVKSSISQADIENGYVAKALKKLNPNYSVTERGNHLINDGMSLAWEKTTVPYAINEGRAGAPAIGFEKQDDGTYALVGDFSRSQIRDINKFNNNLLDVKVEENAKQLNWHEVESNKISATETEMVYEVNY